MQEEADNALRVLAAPDREGPSEALAGSALAAFVPSDSELAKVRAPVVACPERGAKPALLFNDRWTKSTHVRLLTQQKSRHSLTSLVASRHKSRCRVVADLMEPDFTRVECHRRNFPKPHRQCSRCGMHSGELEQTIPCVGGRVVVNVCVRMLFMESEDEIKRTQSDRVRPQGSGVPVRMHDPTIHREASAFARMRARASGMHNLRSDVRATRAGVSEAPSPRVAVRSETAAVRVLLMASTLLQALTATARPTCLSWLRQYSRRNLRSDVLAGFTIAVIHMPQGLANATLAGLPLVYGLYSGIVPAIVYAMFGTSRQGAVGPQSILSLLIAASLAGANVASAAEYVVLAMVVAVWVGVLCTVMGLMRLGFLVSFISTPLLNGFASASAVITIVAMLKDMLRIEVRRSTSAFSSIFSTFSVVSTTGAHVPTLVLSLVFVAGMTALKFNSRTKRVPGALVALAVAVPVMASWLAVSGELSSLYASDSTTGVVTGAGIILVGRVPEDLPSPAFPSADVGRWLSMLTTGFFCAFVGFVESIAVAKMYALKHGYDINASKELVAIGAANIVGAMFGSFPVMCAFSRSAINDATGAKTQLAGLLSGFFVAALVTCIGPVLFFVPKCIVAATVAVAVSGLIDVSGARRLWRTDRRDLAVMFISFGATLEFGVQTGIVIAVVFSLGLFVALNTRPRIEVLGRVRGTVIYQEMGYHNVVHIPCRIARILKFMAPLFFANAGVLKDRLLEELVQVASAPQRKQWRALVVDFSNVSTVDSTAIQVRIA